MPDFNTIFRLTFPWAPSVEEFLQNMEEAETVYLCGRPWREIYDLQRTRYLKDAGFKDRPDAYENQPLPYTSAEKRFIAEINMIEDALIAEVEADEEIDGDVTHVTHVNFRTLWSLWIKETEKPAWGHTGCFNNPHEWAPNPPVNICGCNGPLCEDNKKAYVVNKGFFSKSSIETVAKINAAWAARQRRDPA